MKEKIEEFNDNEVIEEAFKRIRALLPGQKTLPETKEPKQFPAVCSVCGKDTTVPFKPRPDANNIKCRECFLAEKGR